MKCIGLTAALCIALLLAGCATSPSARFYTLDSAPGEPRGETGDVVIGLRPLTFPEYLNRPQIVTRTDGSELKLAEFDRWAEPVDQSFNRVLAGSIDDALESAVVLVFPDTMNIPIDIRVVGRVFRFDTDSDGTAVLDVQWGAGDGKKQIFVAPRRSRYEAKASNPNNFNAIVGALNETVQALSKDMAEALVAIR